MGLLKFIKDENRRRLDTMSKYPALTGVYGSTLLDKILSKEVEPFVEEGRKQGYEQATKEYEKNG